MVNLICFKKGKTGLTGRLIRDQLCCYSQRSIERRRLSPRSITKLIRWGSSDYLGEEDNVDVLNSIKSIENSSNKLKALQILKEANISVPWFRYKGQDVEDKIPFPVVGRTTYHQGGSGFNICRDLDDLEQDFNSDSGSSHWLELINVHKEWRVHIFKGEVIGVSRKTDEGVEDRIRNKYTRNHSNGWRFIKCDVGLVQDRLKEIALQAVNMLGLDFGAVDIILSDGTESTSETGGRKYYVLEVNSAPSVEKGSTILSEYIWRFKKWLDNY